MSEVRLIELPQLSGHLVSIQQRKMRTNEEIVDDRPQLQDGDSQQGGGWAGGEGGRWDQLLGSLEEYRGQDTNTQEELDTSTTS